MSIALLLVALLLTQATRLEKEVGYASYFGPEDSRVSHLSDFLNEFQSGICLLVVFSCHEANICETVGTPPALAFIARLQHEIDRVPHVHRTWSILNSPIVDGPLASRTIGTPGTSELQLAADWRSLLDLAMEQQFITSSVISPDGMTAGIVVELQSVQSEPMRSAVHALTELVQRHEKELGATIYMAGDPVWTVFSADSLDRDSNLLTALMFVVMLAFLWLTFRDVSLSVLPVVSIGILFVAVQGLTGLLEIPLTSVLAALPPLIVVIAMTSSIHFLSAALRELRNSTNDPLETAAENVGAGCFWSATTTALGFASFLLSDLVTTQDFGLLAAIGLMLSFLVTFTVLPALLSLRMRIGSWRVPPHRASVPADFLAATSAVVSGHPAVVLAVSSMVLLLLLSGIPRLHYASDFGFGEESYVFRSLRFIESNLRPPMSTEVVISIPRGRFIYDERSLELVGRVEEIFEEEETTGGIWSVLDLLEEAYRVDHGRPPNDIGELIESARREIAIVSTFGQAPSYWSVTVDAQGAGEVHRARVSVHRGWLDDHTQGPYVERVLRQLDRLQQEYGPEGYRVEMEGGLVLADLFVERLRDTQLTSFLSAFAIVAITLAALLRGDPTLLVWSVLANVLPVLALIGLMGWAGIGIDPANTMVGAILLVIAVDDTLHIALRYRRERTAGKEVVKALAATYTSVGEAVVVSTICLAVGFSVLTFSQWAGLMWFGVLASLGVILALLGDLLVLPAGLIYAQSSTRAPKEVHGSPG